MGSRAFVYQNWSGGQAIDKKVGNKNAFANSQSLDFRKSPSQLSVLPATRRADAGVVEDLIQNEVMVPSGRIYAVGSNGFVYTCSPSGVWSVFGNLPEAGTFGISYRQDQDSIYIAGTTTVSSITNVSKTPTFNPGYYNQSQSLYDNTNQAGFNVNSNQSNSTQTTAIGLTATSQRYFQTDIQPISRIGVYIRSKGTGDWTLTVKDGLGTILATSTVLNTTLTDTSWNYFNFTIPIQVNVGPNNAQTYNWQLVSTVANGTIQSLNFNDLASADMQLWANRLAATNNGLHPMQTFQQFETIGNGRYLSVWEPLGEESPSNAAWQRQKLSFPPGYEVCGSAVFNEYLVIATERTTTGDNTPQDGIIFYWDGLSDTYNYFTRIPEGSPQAIHEYENVIYYVAAGNWYIITSVAATPTKIRALPGNENVYTNTNSLTKLYPYAATTRHGVQLLGYPCVTTNQTIPFGVYSWGKVDYTMPNSFGYSYLLSSGTQYHTDTNNLTIGMVKNFGNILHISWREGTSFGIDVVDVSSTPSSFALWESLIFDGGFVTKDKLASYLEVKWLDIQDGVGIVLKYSINRGDWVKSETFTNSNTYQGITNFARFDMNTPTTGDQERFNEVQIGIDIYCDSTVTLPPEIIGASAIYSDLSEEVLI